MDTNQVLTVDAAHHPFFSEANFKTNSGHKRPAAALPEDSQAAVTLPPSRTLKTENGRRTYAPITWKDLKSGPTHIDTEGCSTNGVEAIVEGSECAKAATDNKTVPTALAKERCDVGVQKFDVETKADTIDPDTTQNPSNGLYDVVLGQKAALSDIGEKVTAISGKLEELYTAFERLESAQNAILKRVSRRSLYNQFLID